MKANYHTHCTWCDGHDTPEAVLRAAVEKGFDVLGFSSHAMLPAHELNWSLSRTTFPEYARNIRELARSFAPQLRVLCGVEADYVQGGSSPDRAVYAFDPPDYIIGSIHTVVAPDGFPVGVDSGPGILAEGIRDHFGGDAVAYVHAYFEQQRDMIAAFDFDVVGHPDLVRKFNVKHPYFDERAPWYVTELEKTADALAASGKLTEVNTGAISRGWLEDAYPSPLFRKMLRERGVKFILSADAHSADALDCAFDRFAGAEDFVYPF